MARGRQCKFLPPKPRGGQFRPRQQQQQQQQQGPSTPAPIQQNSAGFLVRGSCGRRAKRPILCSTGLGVIGVPRVAPSRPPRVCKRSPTIQKRRGAAPNTSKRFKARTEVKRNPRSHYAVASIVLGATPYLMGGQMGGSQRARAPKGCRSSLCGRFYIDSNGNWIPRRN